MKKILTTIVAGLLIIIIGCTTGPEKRRTKDPVTTGTETIIQETNKIIKDTIRTTGKEVRKETRKVIRGE